MAQIRLLDKQVSDMIAAGEVIDRPAAVARELMENAIDAGATQITLEIRRGGTTFLRVTDNGCGIPAEEVALAFQRHATSKIGTAKDLEELSTLGFRGEALAAIAAVAHVMMITRTKDQKLGYSYVKAFGEEGDQGEVGCPEGTTVIVRALFANSPNQYKFLKRDATEGAALHETVQREALAHPEISFRLIREGKLILSTPGDDSLENTIYAVLGDEVASALIPIRGERGDMAVTGFITRPTACLPSRTKQFFFVNGRWIRSKLVMAALENGYQNQRMVGRFPGAVLHLAVRYSDLDVNRDPAKAEVRFVNDRDIYDGVYYGVVSALGGEDDRPVIRLNSRGFAIDDPQGEEEEPPKPQELVFDSPAASQTAAPPAPRPVPADPWTVPAPPAEEKVRPIAPAEEGSPSLRPSQAAEVKWEAPPAAPVPPPAPAPSAPGEQMGLLPEGETPWRVVGEVLRTYIIVEQGEKVFFIDKHAAHERMGFDALKAADYRPMAQELLTPEVVKPGAEEAAVLLEHAGELEEFGFHVEEFGDGALVVRQVPDYIAPEEAGAALGELAQAYLTAGTADPGAQRDELMHTMACKAAMKGGQRNRPEELERVARAVMSGQVTHCPHGRPVAVELTRYQLEKEFKRV